MKKVSVLLGVLLLILCTLPIFAGGQQEGGTLESFDEGSLEGKSLSIMTFTTEFEDQGIVADFMEKTGVIVDLQIIPMADYEAKIRPLLKTGKNVPDIFVGEAAYVKQFVDAGYWDALDQSPYNADVSDQFDYAVQMGSDQDGTLRALTWQMTPAGWCYRRSIAKEVLGTDDPDEVAEYFSTWDKVLETAEMMKQAGYTMFPGIGDGVFRVFYGSRSIPWINADNEFNIDPNILEYLRVAKQIRDNGYDAKLSDWSGPFFEAMNTSPADAKVFVYGWPTWGLHFVLSGQAESMGDWGITSSPNPWSWGGTWLGVYRNSTNKAAAWAFIEMLTQDKEYMTDYAQRTGDFMSNITVVENIMDTFSSETLSGQNQYDFFYNQAQYVDGSAIAGEDFQIGVILAQLVNEYLEGSFTYDEVIEELKERVKSAYPSISIE